MHYSWTVTFDVLKFVASMYTTDTVTAEPSHLMYWNKDPSNCPDVNSYAEPSHLMYWNYMTNRNCQNLYSWTVTFDVLKYEYWEHPHGAGLRWTVTFDVLKYGEILRNLLVDKSWTVTFDVLKYMVKLYKGWIWIAEPSHLMYWN